MFQKQPFIRPLHKIGVFEQFTKFTAKYLCWSLFLIKLQFWRPATLSKKTPTQVLSREIYKLFKNNYFEEHLLNAASKHYLKKLEHSCFLVNFVNYSRTSIFKKIYQPVRGSFLNKVTSLTAGLTAWRLLSVLESDRRTVLRDF